MPKPGRPVIPEKTIFHLWAVAGGRCQFRDCNEPLWFHSLTLKVINQAHIGHIIAYSPKGPRGDVKLSGKLSREISNLMLLCFVCHDLVDDHKYVKDYPVHILRQFKQEHEDRIWTQTEIKNDLKTTLLIFKANITGFTVNVRESDTYQAIKPRYPEREKEIIDLTPLDGRAKGTDWNLLQRQVRDRVERLLRNWPGDKKVSHLSIFGIASIPLLVQLGASVGNIVPADIYQLHRDTKNWKWKSTQKVKASLRRVRRFEKKPIKVIALVLSISGKIHLKDIRRVLPKSHAIYEIFVTKPSLGHMKFRGQLDEFRSIYRKTLTEIYERYGSGIEIYLFPAVPVSIAVACGSELLPKADPPIRVYDFNKASGGFDYTITINKE